MSKSKTNNTCFICAFYRTGMSLGKNHGTMRYRRLMPDAENKIWHKHPVWFPDGNPIAGYSKLEAGIRLMFWSGASFDEKKLKTGAGKFKDASIIYTGLNQIDSADLERWISKSRHIQWDYKHIYKRKGKLVRIKQEKSEKWR